MKVRSSIMSLLSLAGIVMSQPLIAQEASADTSSGQAANDPAQAETSDLSDEIIVNGTRLQISKLKSDLTAISHQISGQLARYQDPVCVHVSGFPEDRANVVRNAIASLATEAGLKIAGISCRPNLTVIIAPDGRQFVERMKIARPELFAQLTGFRRRQLLEQSEPSWSWQTIEPKRADGAPVQYISELIVDPSKPPQRLPKGAYQVQGARLSRLSLPIRHDITGTFVVIDQTATFGFTLQQIADYAGVLALSGANERSLENLSAPSILKLFFCGEDSCPQAATDFDKAFLKARYSGSADLSADKDLMRIASSIAKELSAVPLGVEDGSN